MINNYTSLYSSFDPKVFKDLEKIREKIEEEESQENVDGEKLMKLRMQQLYRGMELNSGYGFNNNMRGIPY